MTVPKKFMIDGVEVAAPSLGPLYQYNRVSQSYNDMYGNFKDRTIAQKDKFLWEYKYITASEMKVIEDLTKSKISSGEKNNSFMVTSWTPDRGFVTKQCYLGGTIDYEVLASFNGEPTVFAVKYHWIQIPGRLQL